MQFDIHVFWWQFLVCLALLAIVGLVRYRLQQLFYTVHVFFRKFTILDLEFPSSSRELSDYLVGISELPADVSKRIRRALARFLWLNFVFQPLLFACVFFFCMFVAAHSSTAGRPWFAALAWFQVLPLLCALTETIYLLKKVENPGAVSGERVYKIVSYLVRLKYGIPVLSVSGAAAILCFLFLSGGIYEINLQFAFIFLSILVIYFVLMKIFSKMQRLETDSLKDFTN